jgi:hypothetical protein
VIGQLFWEWIPPYESDSPLGRHLEELGFRSDPHPRDNPVVLLCDECGLRLVNDPGILGPMKPQRKIANI